MHCYSENVQPKHTHTYNTHSHGPIFQCRFWIVYCLVVYWAEIIISAMKLQCKINAQTNSHPLSSIALLLLCFPNIWWIWFLEIILIICMWMKSLEYCTSQEWSLRTDCICVVFNIFNTTKDKYSMETCYWSSFQMTW